MAFFRNMTFPRVIILLCVIGGAVLFYFYDKQAQRLDELKQEVAEAPLVGIEIQQLALRLRELQRKLDKENISVLENPDLYIRKVAQQRNVDIGNVEIDPKEDSPAKGIVDKKYVIDPQDKRRGKDLTRITNFLYQLEAGSRRVRVTHLKLSQPKAVKPHEVVPDLWTFEAEITSRQRTGGEG